MTKITTNGHHQQNDVISEESEDAELSLEDARVRHLEQVVMASLRTKADRWKKMFADEENVARIENFFDEARTRMLVFSASSAGVISVTHGFDDVMRKDKCAYVMRRLPEKIVRDNIHAVTTSGSLSPQMFHQFSSYANQIIFTLLENSNNQHLWPAVVSQDVMSSVDRLVRQVDVSDGQLKGQTILSMPLEARFIMDTNLDDFEADKEEDLESCSSSTSRPSSAGSSHPERRLMTSRRHMIHAIESSVIDWTHQIKEVIRERLPEATCSANNGLKAPTGGNQHLWPRRELDFWKVRSMNLGFIRDQLSSDKVTRAARILHVTGSSYWPTMESLVHEVKQAHGEACDVSKYLETLRTRLELMEEAGNFPELKPHLCAVMRLMKLIWKNCEFYRKSKRIVVLISQFNNMLIDLAMTYADPEELFKSEADDALDKLSHISGLLRHFRRLYDVTRHQISEESRCKDDVNQIWDFPSAMAFERHEQFYARIQQLENLFQTSKEMEKLEKLEFSGTKGGGLSETIEQIHDTFHVKIWRIFRDSEYNSLDLNCQQFMEDYKNFVQEISTIDHTISNLIKISFQDSSGLEAMFKLLAIFSPLRARPIIKAQTRQLFVEVLIQFEHELDQCKLRFDEYFTSGAPTHVLTNKNLPLVAGTLLRISQIRRRIENSKSQFSYYRDQPAMKSSDATRIFNKYDEMMKLLKTYEDEKFDHWKSGIDEICKFNLNQSLLMRDEKQILSVNFSVQLAEMLREVKYLKILGKSDSIPEKATLLYEKGDIWWRFNSNLHITCVMYNEIRCGTLDVEFPLISTQLHRIDEKLKDSLNGNKTWVDENSWEYIRECRDLVQDLQRKTQMTRDNVEKICSIMKTWSENPIFRRRDEKKDTLLHFEDREEKMRKMYAKIQEDGGKIHDLVQENLKLFGADEHGQAWLDYVIYIDQTIVNGFAEAIRCSLSYLQNNTDSLQTTTPLLQIQLLLDESDHLIFAPNLTENGSSFYHEMSLLMKGIYETSAQMKRVSGHTTSKDYLPDMDSMLDLTNIKATVMDRVLKAMENGKTFRNSFDKYSYLWVEDRSEYIRQFLIYNHVLTTEEIESHGELEIPENPPNLDQFKDQIENYEKLYQEVSLIPDSKIFSNWLNLDLKPFRISLLNLIKKWSFVFKEHLLNHVIDSLNELEEFIAESNEDLDMEVDPGDYDGLVRLMGRLVAVRERQQLTDGMFEEMRMTIELTSAYGQHIPEVTHQQLDQLPEKWEETKKKAITARHNVAPLQTLEVTEIRRTSISFDSIQHEFREKFRREAPFLYISSQPYLQLDQMHKETQEIELQLQALQNSADLFEVNLPDFKQLKSCRKDLKNLKILWDMIITVRTSIDDWTLTRWREIRVDEMDVELRRYLKEIRALDKELRAWDAYSGLDAMVKNMMTSLRAVVELQSPAIRDRHWHQLMSATGVRFEMDEETTLADLLALQLHKVEDQVRNIVDKAKKEMGIEKILQEMRVTWSNIEFEYERHLTTNVPLLVSDTSLIETLEDNQVQLQNISTSKFVEYFREEVITWQMKLQTADVVIQSWLQVQRTWVHLESIFISSEDIRSQLPEDTKRFEKIDEDFKDLMQGSEKLKNVIACTSRDGLFEKLEDLIERLSQCEKSLAEYLDSKRLIFPRFYFVSSADLLDILSKGTQPPKITRHLRKLFDNINDLKFAPTEADDVIATEAIGMYSKEGEFVEFDKICKLGGQVENWLARLEAVQRTTIRNRIQEAVTSYEEKARDQWLFDHPAQVALTSSQIWWTTEVGIAFEKLEEGLENSMKEYNKKQVNQLNLLISHLLGDLHPLHRQSIMTMCTIDVHNRDVVGKLIAEKVISASAFTWLSQLRHRWDEAVSECFANICNAEFLYQYEYLGNTSRLVITPLTDRCYITLTQSLNLTMSGAPAGPAGTGKTETTKDLGRALGVPVYVFNCSEQMDFRSIGNIYKGLSQTGAWGCFDEFNRIAVEVLSVVAVQVKLIHDALRSRKTRFHFMGDDVTLSASVGIFITMNPGYAGRTELPENLKALFRPCAMVVPDISMICEIMLVAEGFMEAKILARKFITLYDLCKELCSKQYHYDWGLRAVKSVLVVAGSLRRSDKQRPEEQVLMRALRDFNLPKIVTEDLPVFMGLIGDLFPSLNVPRKRDESFEKKVKKTMQKMKLQPEENFILKVVQLEELLEVRHSVFVIGNSGAGKSEILRVLHRVHQVLERKPVWNDLNPKVLSTDELFGFIHPSTREWKDGLFSTTMRDQSNIEHDGPKWIILDGDIDPMWIESLNTVMDDNKMLTLASNERIPLTNSMRLLFEIYHLKSATPATVSRAGILYVNPQDLGWLPPVTSWIETRKMQTERANLIILFDKYIPTCIEAVKNMFKTITPIPENTMIQTLCYLLECLLTPEAVTYDSPRELFELYFVFAAVWSFGGALLQDQLTDHRLEFSRWWTKEFKHVKFPSTGTVFDFYIDPKTRKFVPWSEKVPNFVMNPELPIQSVMVDTTETTRIRYFFDLLVARQRPVMLVGAAGCGKSLLVTEALRHLAEDGYFVANIPFNFYTTPAMLQRQLEKHLEKKAGRNYGPTGNKRLIYFLDDVNMPEVDEYGTVGPHTLIRQHLDYGHWYDRNKLTLKDITNTQYVACMNPTAGSFSINPRLQRHFSVFAVNFPSSDSLYSIFSCILSGHFTGVTGHTFTSSVQKSRDLLIRLSIDLHLHVLSTFLPTAIKFHYLFNLRDLSNVFQGILFATPECLRTGNDVIRLWMHESRRVYGDKMITRDDVADFDKMLVDCMKRVHEGGEDHFDAILEEPNIFCHFAKGIGESRYMPVAEVEVLQHNLQEALENHNDLLPAMNLVLFEDAIMHICRINRILESPNGNALLIGVGGSGKQSLSRLAAFISGLDVFQITLKKGYGMQDLKSDLATLYVRTGVKNIGTVLLMTDTHVADEKFLVLINDHLATGEISDLFADDEMNDVIDGVRNEVRASGLYDSRENCWKFFLDRVKNQLKIVLCFSPVGSTLRVRARKFPALTNCSAIDVFHGWPHEALVSVSRRFVSQISELERDVSDVEECEAGSTRKRSSTTDSNNEEEENVLVENIAQFMAHAHVTVNEVGEKYKQNDRRYNYTTPKSFLEQIDLYKHLITHTVTQLNQQMERLENGLSKLQNTAQQVDDLKEKLAAQEVELTSRNETTEKLLANVGKQTQKVAAEKQVADEEEKKVASIATAVAETQRQCEEELIKAEPALLAATEALNTLNKGNLTELKAFANPPAAVSNVTSAVMCLCASNGKIPKDRSWKAFKVWMGMVEQFLDSLVNYDKENIHENNLKATQKYIQSKGFEPDKIRTKSFAAAGLCAWVINTVKWYEVYCDVEPKRRALAAANAELDAAQTKLRSVQDKISRLDSDLDKLTRKFEEATEEKMRCQKQVETTQETINLANRLVSGLQSEKVRWMESLQSLQTKKNTVSGDVMMTSAFVSYLGYFTKPYRADLLERHWLPFLRKQKSQVPRTEGIDAISLLVDGATIAEWNNQGLPSDRMSGENAAILSNCRRWPLIIDPQLQGIKWIKGHYGDELKVIQLGQKGYLDVIEKALTEGEKVLIENIGETVDPVLQPLLGRNTIKKGKFIKIGDKECDYHPNFKLILQTKLANPHYQPEMQAQTTLINFTVTKDGLEDQLLANVVRTERPDLETLKVELTKQQNNFKITLKRLEDDLLSRLSAAQGNFLGDLELVENLENTKRTSEEIEIKVKEAIKNEEKINEARESYRPVAARASLLYFILNDLHKINPIYQFSLKAFKIVFLRSFKLSDEGETVEERVSNLIDTVTFETFAYTSRGLFEKDKLIFTAMVAFQVLLKNGELSSTDFDMLIRPPSGDPIRSPLDFISNQAWGVIKTLSSTEEFLNLDRDIEGSSKRWKKLVDSETPEKEKLPQEWKNRPLIQQMCVLRALRPDRMTYALRNFIEQQLGSKYVEGRQIEFSKTFEETSRTTPIFFVLSPGVDPLSNVEALGKKLGFSTNNKNLHNVSLGQGQEIVAEEALKIAAEQGHWTILQNIHLVAKWLTRLDDIIEANTSSAHEDYRVFISAEPAPDASQHIIPQGILENSIKITSEPPTGMMANLHAALDHFNQETLEMCARELEFRSIFFSLCYFHSAVAERRKFGAQGWNRSYPFNTGDLTISVDVLYNYLESNVKVPWTDLRYLFGEIMYGGHITDDWDRRLCKTYLQVYMDQQQIDSELFLSPGFPVPPSLDYGGYHSYVDEMLPPESPILYGLHPNAEVGILTVTSTQLFETILEMTSRDSAEQDEGAGSPEEMVRTTLESILERLPEEFVMSEVMSKTAERTPYILVCFQECERMNLLLREMRRSLRELDLGLKGELTISAEMEQIQNSLFLDRVPVSWSKIAYPSMDGLTNWYSDLLLRCRELDTWTHDLQLPAVVWIGGLFNPQSFLTAIMQSMARKNEWPLDKMVISVDVTKKNKDDFSHPPREGAYLHGLYLEGARWDLQTGLLAEAKLKELTAPVPIIYAKAIPVDRAESKNIYECPLYRTRERGPTFVWTFNLKSKEPQSKWILAGTALLLSI